MDRPEPSVRVATLLRQSLAMILAGGEGQRLYPLTRLRAKPAVRFGGVYRIIDFTLSNCINSGLRHINLLTQYGATSLQKHIRLAWSSLLTEELGEYLEFLPPQRLFADRWYAGTADAIFQNLMILQQERPERVFLLSGDHIYKLDYARLLAFHEEREAEVTIACVPRPLAEARQFGVVQVDADHRIIGFQEKPREPAPMPEDPEQAYVSMGVYIWNTEELVRAVAEDATTDSSHDFGKDLIPRMVARGQAVYAYPFNRPGSTVPDYWRDIGTLDSYWRSTLDLVGPLPELNLYDRSWPLWGSRMRRPPAKCVHGPNLLIRDSLLAPGCIVCGAEVVDSVLSPGVQVWESAAIADSVLMDDAAVGSGAVVHRAIVDEGVQIPAGYEIGVDPEQDRKRFVVTEGGVTVVPSGVMFD